MSKYKILVVEPDPKDVNGIKRTLENLAYSVTSFVSTGTEALLKAEKDNPDLVLMNIFLPGSLSGIEAARKIYNSYDIPIVYITSCPDEQAVKAAGKAKSFGCLYKPIIEEKLQVAIEIALSRHAREKELRERKEISSQFFSQATDTFCRLDSDLNILEVDGSFTKKWGMKKRDIKGKNLSDFIPQAKNEDLSARFKEVIKTGKPLSIDDLILSPRFGERNINLKAFKTNDGLGLIITDITDRKKTEQALQESERRFCQLVEQMNESVLMLDENGIITFVNNRFLENSGYTQDEIIGHSPAEFLAKPSIETFNMQIARRKKGLDDSYEIEVKAKNGQRALLLVSAARLHDEGGHFKGSIVVLTDITERRRFEEELNRSHEDLRRLSRHMNSVREKESKRISHEIHDILGHALTALRMEVYWLSNKLANTQQEQLRVINRTKFMSAHIDQTIKKVQKIASELRPEVLDDLGLISAIEWQAHDFQDRTQIKCRTHLDSFDVELDPECTTAIFRIFQEALTNVARHADATCVGVSLKENKKRLELKISDNGKGIAEKDILSPDSLGLIGMRERIRPFDGEINIRGVPDRGTTLSITIPLNRIQKP